MKSKEEINSTHLVELLWILYYAKWYIFGHTENEENEKNMLYGAFSNSHKNWVFLPECNGYEYLSKAWDLLGH